MIGITGASGVIIGIRLLQALKRTKYETHLVVSKWGRQTIELETKYSYEQISKMASIVHSAGDMTACVSSGSCLTDGMVIVPCSMRTLSAITNGSSDTLIERAADVTVKERRNLVLVPREMPLSPIHLENMLKLSRLGVIILPPMPAFYNAPKTVDNIVDHFVARILDQFRIENEHTKRWSGTS